MKITFVVHNKFGVSFFGVYFVITLNSVVTGKSIGLQS